MVSAEEKELQLLEALELQVQFVNALESNDAIAIRRLISSGIAPDSDIGIECAPLAAAALHGNLEVTIALIDGGANVNLSDDEDETALSLTLATVCSQRNEDDASDENGDDREDFSHSLFQSKHVQVARLLLQSGARIDTSNGYVNEFFMLCCQHGCTELVNLLIDSGADVNARNCVNMTALTHAIFQPIVFKLLIDRGADVTIPCDLGITVLDVLLGEKSLELAQLVVDRGGDVNERNYYLTRAARDGQYEVVQFLLRKGVDPSRTDDEGETPLHLARFNGHHNIVLLLREALGLPGAEKLEAARIVREQCPSAPIELGTWQRLLQSFCTKSFERDPGEMFLRSWWFAQKVRHECATLFAPTAISSWIPEDRFFEEDRKDFFEVLAYTTSYVLKKLRAEMSKYLDPRKAHDLHIGYVVALGIAFDQVFELRDEKDGVFAELLNDYYRPQYHGDYEDFWALCWLSDDAFSRKTAVELLCEVPPDDEYNIERYYVYRVSKRSSIIDPAKVIENVLPYRDIGMKFYDEAFFGLSVRTIKRELKRMVNG